MSTPKKPFVLRLNADMMAALEKWATDEFRSTNGQLEFLLHEALRKAGRLPGKGKDQAGRKDPGTP